MSKARRLWVGGLCLRPEVEVRNMGHDRRPDDARPTQDAANVRRNVNRRGLQRARRALEDAIQRRRDDE